MSEQKRNIEEQKQIDLMIKCIKDAKAVISDEIATSIIAAEFFRVRYKPGL